MNAIHVLYDGECGFCRRCVSWLRAQPSYLPIRFVAQQSAEVQRRWPALAATDAPQEMLVVDDAGAVYRAEKAYIVVLYALRRHRRLAMRLARPAMRPLARRVVHGLARYRHALSCLVSDEAVVRQAARMAAPPRCATPPAGVAVRARAQTAPMHAPNEES